MITYLVKKKGKKANNERKKEGMVYPYSGGHIFLFVIKVDPCLFAVLVACFFLCCPKKTDVLPNFSAQVDTQMQITGSILQPNISGNIKLSHGEAYLPHDKGSGAAPNRLATSEPKLPSIGVDRAVASRYVSRFFSSQPATSRTTFPQPSGKALV